MQFTFIDMTGKTLFIRDDAERAQWTQEEMTIELEFPRLEDKVISIGQRVFFIDPATGAHQIYEVKQAQTNEPDHYQTITAEHICISELSDEHIDEIKVTNDTAKNALQGVLNGTLWNVGTFAYNPTSSGDLNRGSVWQAVLIIKDNWNVYIEPRVTLASNGTITRYLDIKSTEGEWNGVRLSIDKNMLDPSVMFDDSEVVTALYGYGGTDPNDTSEEKKEITFADVVWTKTADHPAKPSGQKYIEDPTATALYGRNGRARFGFYQNADITDPNILLQKTWETLKVNSKPAISIDGTVADLYRMGYADQPIKLHDIAMVEIAPAGYKDRVQIIRMTVDLLDPSATTLTIGSYIPNIIYIERKTNEDATGSRGGGGKNKSNQNTWQEFRTTMQAFEDGTGMQIRAVQNDIKRQDEEIAVQEAKITVNYDKITQEVTDRREADNVLNASITVTAKAITQEVTRASEAEGELSGRITTTAEAITAEVTRASEAEGELSGRLTVTADAITAEVTRATTAEGELDGKIVVEAGKITQIVSAVGSNGEVTAASICLAINDNQSTATINAGKIYLLGQTIANTISADYISSKIATLSVLNVAAITATGNITTSNGYIMAPSYYYGGSGNALSLASAVRLMQIVRNGDTYTLQKMDFDDTTWIDVGSFSRATSLSGEWSSGTLTVTATPQGTEFKRTLAQGTVSWDGRLATVPIKALFGSSGQYEESTGWNVTIDGSGAYPSSMTLNQKTNSSGAKQFTAYYLNGSTYVSMGQAYWYSSNTNLNVTSKTVHY
jgi:phage minor structural protein